MRRSINSMTRWRCSSSKSGTGSLRSILMRKADAKDTKTKWPSGASAKGAMISRLRQGVGD